MAEATSFDKALIKRLRIIAYYKFLLLMKSSSHTLCIPNGISTLSLCSNHQLYHTPCIGHPAYTRVSGHACTICDWVYPARPVLHFSGGLLSILGKKRHYDVGRGGFTHVIYAFFANGDAQTTLFGCLGLVR